MYVGGCKVCVTQKLIALCDQRNNLCVTEEIKPNGNLDPKVSNLVSVGVGSSHIDDDDKNATNIIILRGHDTNAMDSMVQVQFLCRPGDWSR